MKESTKENIYDPFDKNYIQLIHEAEIVSDALIKGCLALRPYGHAIWTEIRQFVSDKLEEFGYEDMYFPLFIPESFMKKQEEHYKSFAKEAVFCTRVGDETLEDPFIVRPTSETIIYPILKGMVKSHADLPLKLNQWCSVVRWEILKPTLPLIRNNELLWHESHSLFNDEKSCDEEVKKMIDMYQELIEDLLAISLFRGSKPERRKFAGSEYTLALEAPMANCKSVQMATSHSLGKKFSKVFGIKVGDDHVWQQCSGITTRILGCIVMVHSDEKGLVLPPRIAPKQVIVIGEDGDGLVGELSAKGIRAASAKAEDKDRWILKGAPLIVEMEGNRLKVLERDTLEEKECDTERFAAEAQDILAQIHERMFKKAQKFKEEHTFQMEDYGQFKEIILNRKGFCISPWCGDTECSRVIRRESKGSLRVVNKPKEGTTCIRCGEPAIYSAVFGQSY